MRGAETLIPARFLTTIGHLCVLVTLLWESKQSVQLCLPSQFHQNYFETYHNQLVAGYATSLVLILIELTTFILGLTMFSPTVSLISIFCHGTASLYLGYWAAGGWLCGWFWPVFVFGSILPFCADLGAAITNEHQQLTQGGDYKAGWSFYLVLAGVATTFGLSVPVGYHIGVINTPADILKRFVNASVESHYDVVLGESSMSLLWSSVVAVFIVGGCTGSILGATLADKLGRKKATLVTSFLSLIGAVIFVVCRAADSVELLILGRLIVGLSGGLTTSIIPMYLTELSPPSLTGAMGVACPMGVNVGVLLGQVMALDIILGREETWPYLLAVYAVLVLICLPLLFILPESPKYLYVVRREDGEAIKELSRLRGVSPSLLTEDLDLLKEEVRASEEAALSGDQSWSMLRVLRDSKLRLILLLTCSMQAGQQTSGINAVFYYSGTIFESAGVPRASIQYATIGCGAINVCTAVLMLRLLPRCGRRPLLLGSIACAVIALTALAASMNYMDAFTWMPYVCVVAVLTYVLFYGLGLGPIPYFIASELFEVPPRPAGMAWGSLANWAGNFLVAMAFPAMRNTIGPYSFLVFAVITAALFLFQRFYFPETRGKTPQQITQLCNRGFSSRPLVARDLSDV